MSPTPDQLPFPHPIGRAGVNRAAVRRAWVDRLVWAEGLPVRRRRWRTGVESSPTAVGRLSRMHRAVDESGAPRWVRCTRPDLVRGYSEAYQLVNGLPGGPGFAVPAVTMITLDQVWLTYDPWAVGQKPSTAAIDNYVWGCLYAPLRHGTVVATGQPHVLGGGRIICEDVVVACQLEHDQRSDLASLVGGLIRHRPTEAAHAVREFCHETIPEVTEAARRSCLSLSAGWSAEAFGLALFNVASIAGSVAPRSEPLVLLAEELLHRLDLAHEFGSRPRSIENPRFLDRLLASTPSAPRGSNHRRTVE